MSNTNTFLCLKITEEQWAKKLLEGSICFNPAGYFIKKAELTGNNEQGDFYEGIFGRIRNDDPKLNSIKEKFGADLEVIPDQNYVLLRRKSSKLVPIFCMYGIYEKDLQMEAGKKGYLKAKYMIPKKMFNSFLDNSNQKGFVPWGYYASVGDFQNELDRVLCSQNTLFKRQIVAYDIDLKREFFFEPDNTYSELFHKRKELKYQNEFRYILPKTQRTEKIIYSCNPLSPHSANIAPGELALEMNFKTESTSSLTNT